ncbi:MAG: c-type cytochrome [Planctomycetota bacterium]
MSRLLIVLLVLAAAVTALSFAGLLWLSSDPPPLEAEQPVSDSASGDGPIDRGRRVFEREACQECHTRLGRPPSHHDRWWQLEDVGDQPPKGWLPNRIDRHLLGPDLGREGGKRTDGWHYAHLRSPRDIDALSQMPAFPHLFEEADGTVRPTRDAQDLVAYLQSLGEAPDAPWVDVPLDLEMPADLHDELATWQESLDAANDDEERLAELVLGDEAFEPVWEEYLKVTGQPDLEAVRYTHEPNWRIDAEALAASVDQDALPGLRRGRQAYLDHCSGCHGRFGRGDGPAAALMQIKGVHEENLPRNFSYALYKNRTTKPGQLPLPRDLFATLTNGLPGSAMSSFGTLPQRTRWEIVAYLQTLGVYYDDFEEELVTYLGTRAAEPLVIPDVPPDLEGRVRAGRIQYERLDCASCHGPVTGNGEVLGRHRSASSFEWEDEMGRPLPYSRDFTNGKYLLGPSPRDRFRALKAGLNIGPMPSYSEALQDDEIWDLVAFLMSVKAGARTGP